MPNFSKNIPRGTRPNARGFTLVEMIIAVSISAMIIGGSTFFIFKANSEAQTAKERAKIHVEMTTFIEKMNRIRNVYTSGSVLIQNEPGYDVLLFSNSGATTGMLVGVVNLANPDVNGGVRLDAVSEFDKYGNKAIGIQEITKSQLASLLSVPANAYSVVFQSDRFFPGLQARNFSADTYNSGALIELDADIYERLLPAFVGQPKTAVADETALPYNLIF